MNPRWSKKMHLSRRFQGVYPLAIPFFTSSVTHATSATQDQLELPPLPLDGANFHNFFKQAEGHPQN
jgi:hypothetical protein